MGNAKQRGPVARTSAIGLPARAQTTHPLELVAAADAVEDLPVVVAVLEEAVVDLVEVSLNNFSN